MLRITRALVLLVIWISCAGLAGASQAGPGEPRGGSPSGGPQGAGPGLAGEAHPTSGADAWPTVPPTFSHRRLIWYKVVQTPPVSQPLILVPLTCADKGAPPPLHSDLMFEGCVAGDVDGTHRPSIPDNNRNPLRDGEGLTIAVYDPAHLLNQVLLLVINATTQSVSPLNPAPVRPSVSPSGPGGGGPGGAPSDYYFLTWPNRLIGDTSVTVTVSAILAPPAAPAPPAANPAPSESNINLLSFTYSQVHARSSYNISTGVIFSTIRNPTFNRVESTAAVTCPAGSPPTCVASPEMFETQTVPGSRTIDPALFFTVYAFGRFDAERKWRVQDLKPEPSIGFSLSSAGKDFFIGSSSELLRGVQFVTGWHYGKINALIPPIANDSTSNAAPLTKTQFHSGYFAGITFNISFIQSVFGGGGGKGQ